MLQCGRVSCEVVGTMAENICEMTSRRVAWAGRFSEFLAGLRHLEHHFKANFRAAAQSGCQARGTLLFLAARQYVPQFISRRVWL